MPKITQLQELITKNPTWSENEEPKTQALAIQQEVNAQHLLVQKLGEYMKTHQHAFEEAHA